MKTNLTVKEIVKEYLEAHEYDGLYCEGCGGCNIHDLVCCGSKYHDCRAGYYRDIAPGEEEADYYIGPKEGQFYER